jgi:AcrR family transcriptional regulator
MGSASSSYTRRMSRITQAARDARRQRIIDAAWRCATRKGYRDITVDDVCAEAGISKGAFYGYFDSKQALLVALLEADAAAVDQLMEDLGDREPSSVERLRQFTRAMLERGDDPAQVQVRADLWNAITTEAAVRDGFARTIEQRRTVLREWIEDGVRTGDLVDLPANAFASVLLALGDGLLLHSALRPDAFRWANIRRVVDVLFSGIRAGKD